MAVDQTSVKYVKLKVMVITKTLKDLKPVLMDSKAKGVKEPFYIIEGEEQVVFIVSPGVNGDEFNKTLGHFYRYQGVQVYSVSFGQGVLLMQRNDELGEAKEFKFVNLHPGRQVAVPTGWATCLVNTGKNFLMVIRNSVLSKKFMDEESIIKKHGFAYYVIDKKGDISLEKNPNYRVHPQITTE